MCIIFVTLDDVLRLIHMHRVSDSKHSIADHPKASFHLLKAILDRAIWVLFAHYLGIDFHKRWVANDEVWIADNILRTITHLLWTALNNKLTVECCVKIWDFSWLVIGILGVGLLPIVLFMTVKDIVGLVIIIHWIDMHTAIHMKEALVDTVAVVNERIVIMCSYDACDIMRIDFELFHVDLWRRTFIAFFLDLFDDREHMWKVSCPHRLMIFCITDEDMYLERVR